jgi:type IV secretory pathway TrbD component
MHDQGPMRRAADRKRSHTRRRLVLAATTTVMTAILVVLAAFGLPGWLALLFGVAYAVWVWRLLSRLEQEYRGNKAGGL